MSTDKLLGYPLAILSGFAILGQRPGSEAPALGVRGAGGANQLEPAQLAAELVTPPPSPTGGLIRAATVPSPGRPSGESAELRALRLDEGHLFPELGLSRSGSPLVPPSASCELPSYDVVPSAEFEVPVADNWLKGLVRPEINIPKDARVAKYIRYFGVSPKGRETFATWLRRSGAYRPMVSAALQRHGLPRDLEAVMFVESGCWPTAVSSAGATGLWQLMPKTARAYGLTVRSEYDERRSLWRSTEAAISHLADLRSQFHSWHLALAAYNYGYQSLLRRMDETGLDEFFALSRVSDALPKETVLYVPKILAVAVILRNLEYFGFDGTETRPPLSGAPIEVPPGTRLSLLARAAGTSLRRIKEMNPEVKTETTPDLGKNVVVHLPTTGLARAKIMLPRLLDHEDRENLDLDVASDFDWGRDELDTNWRTRLAQTGSDSSERPELEFADPTGPEPAPAANQDRQDSEYVAAQNEPVRPAPARTTADRCDPSAGQLDPSCRVAQKNPAPSRDSRTERQPAKDEFAYFGEPRNRRNRSREATIQYRIKPGDTLSELARYFHVSQARLIAWNRIENPSRILAGSRLRILKNSRED